MRGKIIAQVQSQWQLFLDNCPRKNPMWENRCNRWGFLYYSLAKSHVQNKTSRIEEEFLWEILQTIFPMLHSEILTLERPYSLITSPSTQSQRHSLCVVPPLCCFLWSDPALPTLVETLSLQPATLPLIWFSCRTSASEKIDLLGQASICLLYFQMPIEVLLIIFLLRNQRPKLKHNLEIRLTWLDLCLFLEDSHPVLLINFKLF